MIGRLTGLAIECGPDGCCVLDVQGVGYEVFMPLRSVVRLPPPPEEVTLHVHTHVREEALTLYGFDTADDRVAFRSMLSVSGVGPKLALAILGDLSADELYGAVARKDKKRFAAVSGVGKKTAERLVLELKDKLPVPDRSPSPAAPLRNTAQIPAGPLGEAANALVSLGFSRAEAEGAIARVAPPEGTPQVEALVRRALAALG